MKFLIICILFIANINLLAIDVSSSEGQSQKEDIDKSFGLKESEENRNSDSTRKSYTKALEESKQNSRNISKVLQTDIFQKLEELEIKDIEDFENKRTKKLGFFGKCSIISNPQVGLDFGITAERGNEIDLNLQSYIDSAAKNNLEITKIISKKQEIELREYMNCLIKYSAIGAQSLIDGNFTTNITDDYILRLNKSAERNLKNLKNGCRFVKSSEIIQCFSFKIVLDYEPILIDKQITYFSKNEFLGISGTQQWNKSNNESSRDEDSNSSEKSFNSSESKDKLSSKKMTDSQDSSVKTEVSARSFFSKLFK